MGSPSEAVTPLGRWGMAWEWRIGWGRKTLLNTEIVAQHVNERESWTKALNLWTQLRMNFDYQLNERWSVYFGPTFNVMWSELYNENTEEYGSVLSLNPVWEEQKGPTNTQAWVGFTAGLRL